MTFVGMLGDAGYSAFVLKQLLGHSKASTSEIYTYTSGGSLKKAIDTLNLHVENQLHNDQ